jgi:hypothetical protein
MEKVRKAREIMLLGAILIMSMCLLSFCSKDKSAGNETKAGATKEKKAAAVATSPFGFTSEDNVIKQLKGSWLVKTNRIGASHNAWEIDDSKSIKVFDGKVEKRLDFELVAPCYAKITEKSAVSENSVYHTFVVDNQTLYKGLGNAGVKRGNDAVACVSGKVYTFVGGKCTLWEKSMFDETFEAKKAECGFKGNKFEIQPEHGGPTSLDVVGNILLNFQMKSNRAEKTASFGKAKAKIKG